MTCSGYVIIAETCDSHAETTTNQTSKTAIYLGALAHWRHAQWRARGDKILSAGRARSE